MANLVFQYEVDLPGGEDYEIDSPPVNVPLKNASQVLTAKALVGFLDGNDGENDDAVSVMQFIRVPLKFKIWFIKVDKTIELKGRLRMWVEE